MSNVAEDRSMRISSAPSSETRRANRTITQDLWHELAYLAAELEELHRGDVGRNEVNCVRSSLTTLFALSTEVQQLESRLIPPAQSATADTPAKDLVGISDDLAVVSDDLRVLSFALEPALESLEDEDAEAIRGLVTRAVVTLVQARAALDAARGDR